MRANLWSVYAERFDFAAVVRAAGQAAMVWPLRLPALRANVEDRSADRVLCTTLVATRL